MAAAKAKKHAPRRRRFFRRLRGWGPVIATLAVVVVVVVAMIVVGNVTRGSKEIPQQTATAEGRTLGQADAPVTIINYSDFQCPYCATAAREILPRIEESFINTGLVRFEFRHMAFIGPESVLAAEASECALDQGHFWDYHNKLFSSQQGENKGAFASENLKRFAGELGLDQTKFDSCLDSHQHVDLVRQETEAGKTAGVESTPTFFIGDEKMTGLRPYSEFEKAIKKALGSQ